MAARHFGSSRRTLSFDHRGLGASEYANTPMTMRDYAADLVRLLDETGIERADFVGLSFGGRVLQELALGWPERIHKLVLGGTSTGGPGHTPGNHAAIEAMQRSPELTEEEWLSVVIPSMFGRRFREAEPERLKNLARWWTRHPPDPRGLALQGAAYQAFDTSDRLHQILAPTLILHGTDDGLSPRSNAMFLVQHLPYARLIWLDGVGHSPKAEDPLRFHAEIQQFLDEPTP
jgi:pimeloyl-ACP methyl ester carboxylesterase